jgi:Fe2+ transport system protein FeoA
MVLTDACEREDLEVQSVNTDYRHRRHLENLSIIKGAKITCLYNRSGDVVIKVRDGRIAINREFASLIEVKSLNSDDYETVTEKGKTHRIPTQAALARFRKEDEECRKEEEVFRAELKKQREAERAASKEAAHV